MDGGIVSIGREILEVCVEWRAVQHVRKVFRVLSHKLGNILVVGAHGELGVVVPVKP